ncbi:MAG: hypothetical protein OXI30_07610 [Chloroflexota bacterium]|nr:hypothetical protein [Chloroflexota bacterium]
MAFSIPIATIEGLFDLDSEYGSLHDDLIELLQQLGWTVDASGVATYTPPTPMDSIITVYYRLRPGGRDQEPDNG